MNNFVEFDHLLTIKMGRGRPPKNGKKRQPPPKTDKAWKERLTIDLVTKTLASMRGGARFTDLQNALAEGYNTKPSFFQLIAVLGKAEKLGLVKKNSGGLWVARKGGAKAAAGATVPMMAARKKRGRPRKNA